MKEVLKQLRTKNRYSQGMIANLLGISRQAYMKYETGEIEPSVEIVRKLSRMYGVSYSTLIDNVLEKDSLENSSHVGIYENTTKNVIVSSSVPEYKSSIDVEINDDFYSNLQYLKKIINSMELRLLEKNHIESSKSKSFDKEEFFKQIGKINMDDKYLDELREESLV